MIANSMNEINYSDHRSTIETGDLLVWSSNGTISLGNSVSALIRIATTSEYSHVGIALWLFGRLFVLEAAQPCIRLVPVSSKEEFYHIPMHLEWSQEYYDWLADKIGLPYSIRDACCGYLGIVLADDNRYQCVELVNKFYKFVGKDFGEIYRPDRFVKTVLKITGYPIYCITSSV